VFEYLLGEEKAVDSEGNDVGCLLKKAKMYPSVYFIKSAFCAK